MSTWLIPNKSEDYDIRKGFARYGNEIEWTKKLQTKNIAIGDTVYIYMSAPVKALTMKFVVTDHNVTTPTQTHNNDGTIVGSEWFKVSFLHDIEPIAYETLFSSGVVNGYIQAARKLKPGQERALKKHIVSKNSNEHMSPDDYREILLNKGFVFLRSQEAWTQHRGLEYIYTHPDYTNQFYVKRVSDEDGSLWGFNPQTRAGKIFDGIAPHNAIDTFRGKGHFMWVDDAFVKLMNGIDKELDNSIKASVILKLRSHRDITTDEITKQISLLDDLDDIEDTLKSVSTDLPPQRIELVVSKIVRDPNIAKLIKESKNYICEVCERAPFIQKNGKPYAEADHIKPLGGSYGGLDTPENMRCLCAQCHAVITHGSSETVGKLLKANKWQL